MKIILPPNLQRKKTASAVLFFLFLVFSALAIWGGRRSSADLNKTTYRRGIDTVFAIDVSRSMDLQDIPGNEKLSRLERGIVIAKQTVLAQPSGRVAVSIGRGRGYLSVPLTYDNEAVLSYLNSLDNQTLMGGRSTNLQSLIEASTTAFQTTSPARRVIVLISDGESHFGVLRNALNYCVREGIVIIALGVGSDEGAAVPILDTTEETENNAPIISKRDVQSLRMAAERTGGIYIDGNRNDAESYLTTQLLSLSQGGHTTAGDSAQQESKNHRPLFVMLAIAAYAAHKFVLRTRKPKEKQERRKSSRVAATHATSSGGVNKATLYIVVVAATILSSCTEGKLLLLEANYKFSRGRYDEAAASYYKALEHEDSAPYADYGLGTTFMAMDEGAEALTRYSNSQEKLKNLTESEHKELHYRLHYNSGIILFEEGDFDSAAASFKEALTIDSSRLDAKRNLEISLMSIQRETQQEKQQDESLQEEKDLMFQMVRQQEEQFWQSGDWAEERFSGPDY